MERYKVIRVFRDRPGSGRVMRTGLTLAEARQWCGNPESSSRSTRPTSYRRRYLAKHGDWMDIYTAQR
jgi:hypothetical protein